MKTTAKENAIRDKIKGQEQKIEHAQKRIAELKQELADYLASIPPSIPPFSVAPKDNHVYCGKILYPSEKAAHAARKLINRDLVKKNKPPMKRAYFCPQCEAWHLTTVEHWLPYPENEMTQLNTK